MAEKKQIDPIENAFNKIKARLSSQGYWWRYRIVSSMVLMYGVKIAPVTAELSGPKAHEADDRDKPPVSGDYDEDAFKTLSMCLKMLALDDDAEYDRLKARTKIVSMLATWYEINLFYQPTFRDESFKADAAAVVTGKMPADPVAVVANKPVESKPVESKPKLEVTPEPEDDDDPFSDDSPVPAAKEDDDDPFGM